MHLTPKTPYHINPFASPAVRHKITHLITDEQTNNEPKRIAEMENLHALPLQSWHVGTKISRDRATCST